jgi:hypothetical protein
LGWGELKMDYKKPTDKRIAGCNPWGADTDCEYCKEKAEWAMHNDDHIGVCDKSECVTKAIEAGYHACGCGG